MMIDIETSLSKNLDAQLWKSCFHNVIERFREYDKQSTDNSNVKKCIETVIEDVNKQKTTNSKTQSTENFALG